MAIPNQWQMMKPLLEVLNTDEELTNIQYQKALADYIQLSNVDRNDTYSNGGSKYTHNAYWAKFYLEKSGLLEFPKRGTVRITDLGKQVLDSNTVPTCKKDLLQHPKFLQYLKEKEAKNSEPIEIDSIIPPQVDDVSELAPQEVFEQVLHEVNYALKQEILSQISNNNPYFFEKMVLDVLLKMGYGGSRAEAIRATKKSGDEGIDGIINEDKLGLDSIYVQAKRWKDNSVGRPEIQKFVGALIGQGATKGIFITTSTFTKEAIEYAQRTTNAKIVLINGDQLAQYMIDFNVGVSVEATYEIKKIDSDYFIE